MTYLNINEQSKCGQVDEFSDTVYTWGSNTQIEKQNISHTRWFPHAPAHSSTILIILISNTIDLLYLCWTYISGIT